MFLGVKHVHVNTITFMLVQREENPIEIFLMEINIVLLFSKSHQRAYFDLEVYIIYIV